MIERVTLRQYKRSMRIIVTGLVGQYAFGGVAWDYLQFVGGFRQLGHEVLYVEDTGRWPYDPVQATYSADCSYSVRFLRMVMDQLGLGDQWVYRNGADDSFHGLTETQWRGFCRDARLFLNLSASSMIRPEYATIPHRVLVDTDPMFTQLSITPPYIQAHNHFATFAENIGQPDCRVPKLGLTWVTTRQPVVLEWWPLPCNPPRPVWTTVMNWVSYKPVEHNGETWGQKDVEFRKFLDLPARSGETFEIACGRGPGNTRPTELLRQHGWQIVEPDERLPDPWSYRDYLATSRGEWSVAKEGYVKSRSGWFSCRSACYLALGRPCVLQDTGWTRSYPTGHGLWAFQTIEEAVTALHRVRDDYTVQSHAARRIAEQYFDARLVLQKLLDELGIR
ncbi:MAG: glycosyltransferase family 1 protein [Verrucomicrobiae bacterium]|nr:glycosyltransferase family 1 protein [Verrucomicrobiae bacterium]